MEKETKSPIEMLLDEENTENIVLYDENNKETEFEQIAIIPIEDKIYAILAQVGEEALSIFAVETIDDEDCIVLVEDDEIIEKVWDEYTELLFEAGHITKEEYDNYFASKKEEANK